ncbi:hypothetical protein J2Y45_006164 [Dyadobacter sp. BE34]|uniref:Luciferase domain-containing protein n=1 Tax=Dyadobacter fermentans TaxID=94254 RepID=A0ABU1R6C3_9BACT|nr:MULTISPECIES: luciferase family protein [Dyadobacter]MDR6808950.1 hypothetical protein [Dyadobacter fermentans]MDR7046693.1 hypothetical protein [Dyadobacter sp. BE242]MDR7201007.1 hypothetical protein [Dyadobacter sp. BE34]MDR7218967.1 hypothetical protein [Dyadobacter sp. BE31]MDR7264823.1 hypothetical protein [Dyadobacter sp. BE32]
MIRKLAAIFFLLFVNGVVAQSKPDGQSTPTDLDTIKAQLTPEEFKEYQSWVALGVGGLPHTVEGFRTLQSLNKKLRNPLDISQLVGKMGATGDVKTLRDLPKRTGARPTIAPFAIPHRQTDQHNNTAIRDKQKALFDEVVAQNKSLVHIQKSYFERHNDAVFLNDSTKGNKTVVTATHAEVGHLHPTDGSMHFSLSPSDTKEVLEKGWGELHGLAGQIYKPGSQLPSTYMMVYSPRTEGELVTIKKILEAAILYSSLRTTN